MTVVETVSAILGGLIVGVGGGLGLAALALWWLRVLV